MKRILNNKKIEYICVLMTLIALTLIKIFPIYLGGSYSKVFTTHIVAKLLLVIPFLYAVFKNILFPSHKPKTVHFFFVASLLSYLFAVSLSVIVAIDVISYLRQFQNIIINGVLFYLGYLILSQKQYRTLFLNYLIGMGIFCILFDITFLLLGDHFIRLFSDYIQVEMLALFIHNARMGRFSSYLVLDSFIPILFYTYYHSQRKKVHKVLATVSLIIIMFLSYASLFRTRLIQGIFATVASFFIFFRKKTGVLLTLLLIPLLFLTLYFITKIASPTSTTTIDRFLLSDKGEDVGTIEYRFDSLSRALDMLKTSPIIGVGIGNYKSYVSKIPGHNIVDKLTRMHYEETLNNPHSIFIEVLAETGLLGLLGYLGILSYFLYMDVLSIRKGSDKYILSFITLTWTLFLYGIFNPFNTVYITGWFWCIRGYIQAHYTYV